MQPILHLLLLEGADGREAHGWKSAAVPRLLQFLQHTIYVKQNKKNKQKKKIWTLPTWKNHYNYLLLCVMATLGSIGFQGQERKP